MWYQLLFYWQALMAENAPVWEAFACDFTPLDAFASCWRVEILKIPNPYISIITQDALAVPRQEDECPRNRLRNPNWFCQSLSRAGRSLVYARGGCITLCLMYQLYNGLFLKIVKKIFLFYKAAYASWAEWMRLKPSLGWRFPRPNFLSSLLKVQPKNSILCLPLENVLCYEFRNLPIKLINMTMCIGDLKLIGWRQIKFQGKFLINFTFVHLQKHCMKNGTTH